MKRSILYYPTIDIKDGEWLRNAVLYWDEICSIVPDQDNCASSPEIQYLLEEGMYRPVYPKDLFISEENEAFSKAVMRKLEKSTRERNNFLNTNSSYINKQKFKFDELNTLVHYKKIPTTLYDFMFDKGFLTLYNDSNWIEMDNYTANIYMATLAEHMAKIDDNDMVIGTDINKNLYFAFDRVRGGIKNFCLTTILEKAMPIPNPDVGFEDLLDFRRKRIQELLELRLKLRELENTLSVCKSIEEVKACIQDFREKWQIELIKMDKILKERRIGYHLGNIKSLINVLGDAASIIQAISLFTNNMPSWLIGTGLGAGGLIGVGTNCVNHKASLKQHRENSGFAYLCDAYNTGIIRKSEFLDIL